jgi:hypothetical protein
MSVFVPCATTWLPHPAAVLRLEAPALAIAVRSIPASPLRRPTPHRQSQFTTAAVPAAIKSGIWAFGTGPPFEMFWGSVIMEASPG